MRSITGRLLTVVRSGVAAFLILAFGQGLWGTLAFFNLKTSASFPWSVAVMAPLLWWMWRILGGQGWPRKNSETRQGLLRAKAVPGRVMAWAVLAGALSIASFSGFWIVMFQLFKMPGNVVPDLSKYPLYTLAAMLVMGSIAAPLSEEAAFRGYAQVMLERTFRGPAAVVMSSVMFALAHLTQGFLLPKLFVYFLAGLALGVTAYLTKSILPGIVVHVMADLTFFTMVWPYDTTRRLVSEGGADAWFWVHVAQAVVFAGLAIWMYTRGREWVAGRRFTPALHDSMLASH